METKFTANEAESLISGKLSRYYGVSFKEADKEQIYKATVMAVKDILLEKRDKFSKAPSTAKECTISAWNFCSDSLLKTTPTI